MYSASSCGIGLCGWSTIALDGHRRGLIANFYSYRGASLPTTPLLNYSAASHLSRHVQQQPTIPLFHLPQERTQSVESTSILSRATPELYAGRLAFEKL